MDRISGPTKTTELRHRILNLLMFVALATGVYFFVTDFFIDYQMVRIVYDASVMFFFSFMYWMTRFEKRFRLVSHVGCAAGLVFYVVNFLVNAGINGPTLVVVILVLAFITILHSPIVSTVYLTVGVLLVGGCLLVQYSHPEWIEPYASPSAQIVDVAVTFLFCALVMFFVMRMLMRFFRETLRVSRDLEQSSAQAEKMVALGEMLASLNHEFSSPVAVLGSTLGHLQSWWQAQLPSFHRILSRLNPGQLAAFWQLIANGSQGASQSYSDTRAQRSARDRLVVAMEAFGEGQNLPLAQRLAELHLYTWDPQWQAFLLNEAGREAFLFALEFLSLERATGSALQAHNKILGLVDSVAAFSRTDVPEKERLKVQVADSLDTVLSLYTTAYRSLVEVHRDYETVTPVLAFPDQLVQVWTNLIKNALQAMPRGGRLTVKVRQQASQVVVSISDTGAGVPEGLRDKIFATFYTTKAKGEGTGLGLGIVKRIVEAHGGKVTVGDSDEGGAQFDVFLPAAF